MSKVKGQKSNVKGQTSNASIDVDHVAKLASLNLTPAEEKTFGKQLAEVLQYIQSLNEIDTSKVQPIGQITGLSNVKREDIPQPSLSQEESLANVKRKHNGFVEVEAILEEQ